MTAPAVTNPPTAESAAVPPVVSLSEADQTRLRQELAYLSLVIRQKDAAAEDQSITTRLFKLVNSGLGLLLIGTLVGSILIPYFQRRADAAQKRVVHAQETLSHFLAYANTPWEEYHVVIPLTVNPALDRNKYETLLSTILAIKLRRYNAFAALEAQAAVFRDDPTRRQLPALLHDYAVAVNTVSDGIARSLGQIYCANGNCVSAPSSGNVPISKNQDQIHALDEKQAEITGLLTSVSP